MNTEELRIVRGNAFNIKIQVEAIRLDGTIIEHFHLANANAQLKVWHAGELTPKEFVVEDNNAIISFDGTQGLGWYGLEMSGTFEGAPWRFAVTQVFQIVETNEKANVPSWTILTDQTYFMEGAITMYASGATYQADWDETDTTSPSYIKNKPNLGVYATKSQLHSTEQQLQHNIDQEETRAKAEEQNIKDTTYTKQQVEAMIADFITRSVNDLMNYYLKSETYTKAEVQLLIDAVKQFTYEVVETLPTASADTMHKIYLVPSTNPQTQNVKDEYITISTTSGDTTTYSWEQIGTTTVDLSGYYTALQTDAAISNALNTALASYSTTQQMNNAITTALNTALADYSTTNQMNAAIAAALVTYYTKTEVDSLIANFITRSVNDLLNYYLKSETYTKAEVQQLIDAVKQFTYEVVTTLPTASADTMHKIYLVPSTNPQTQNVKDEYITIATTSGSTTTYSWEQIGTTTVDLSGYYTSAQTDQAISNALSSALAAYSTTTQMNNAITTALNNALAAYSTTTQMNEAIAAALTPYYTKTEIDNLLADKADTDGNYPDLVAGNIVGEFNQEAEVSFRPSAGTVDIQSGYQVNYGGHLEGVKGNSVAWNQMVGGKALSSNTMSYDQETGIFTCTGSNYAEALSDVSSFIAGHKYYMLVNILKDSGSNISAIIAQADGGSKLGISVSVSGVGVYSVIGTSSYSGFVRILAGYPGGGTIDAQFKCNVIDLTLMFGAGNEPATPADFEADYLRWFGKPLAYEAYNAGELIPVKMAGLLTVGFNQWDEQWELGFLGTDGSVSTGQRLLSKNFIPIIGGQSYYLHFGESGTPSYCLYDASHTIIGERVQGDNFVAPSDARYMKFMAASNYPTTYNHDICINLSHSGERNGEYEPHWSSLLPFGVTKVYGKLNGEGSLVQISPDGMKSAGSVRDELTFNGGAAKAIKRIDSVDLGTLTWTDITFTNGEKGFMCSIMDGKASYVDTAAVCSGYEYKHKYVDTDVDLGDKCAWKRGSSYAYRLYVHDSSYSDAATFQAAMNGVMLYYELETPLTYTDLVYRENGVDYPLDGPLPYKVEDYGTEEVVAISGQRTVAPVLDLRYGINAGDTIRNLPFNYLSPKMQQTFTEAEQRQARKNIGVDVTRADVLALIRANEDALLLALKTAGKITDYTLDADADANGVFGVTVS